jgi:hypothetical protein
MHFGKVRSGELYSVSPMATLGPTVREFSKFGARKDFERNKVWSEKRLREKESWERAKTSSEGENEITRDFKSEITREDFERSRVDGSRVREFESSSSTVV